MTNLETMAMSTLRSIEKDHAGRALAYTSAVLLFVPLAIGLESMGVQDTAIAPIIVVLCVALLGGVWLYRGWGISTVKDVAPSETSEAEPMTVPEMRATLLALKSTYEFGLANLRHHLSAVDIMRAHALKLRKEGEEDGDSDLVGALDEVIERLPELGLEGAVILADCEQCLTQIDAAMEHESDFAVARNRLDELSRWKQQAQIMDEMLRRFKDTRGTFYSIRVIPRLRDIQLHISQVKRKPSDSSSHT